MRILHVILSRGFAGSERSTAESCNAQSDRHSVALAVRSDHRRAGASILDQLNDTVRVEPLPARFGTRRALARLIDRFGPDIIHCHLRRSTRLVAALQPAAATVATLHLSYNADCFGQMDGLVCNARWQLDDIPPGYAGEVFKADNSLTPHRRISFSERRSLRRELGGDEGIWHIGGVGRMTRKKGWDVLIRAFRRADPGPSVRLNLFGSGSARRSLARLAAGDDRIRLHGFRQDIKDYYQAFDLFVCPSRYEPLPRVMLEAMDAGTPVVASAVGGCVELVESYGGELFPPGDVEALAAILSRLATDPPARHRPDLSAHHLDRSTAKLESFYRRLLPCRPHSTS
ncbi:MAG: glycosyltransferase [Wenzhouxiangella sp.]|nr:MAG: glycosyltransferase [Wenzhouxiangella sp.]